MIAEPKTLHCTEIWGGVRNADLDVCAPGLTASLFSSACEGGKGGDIYYFSICSYDLQTRVAVADVVGHGQVVSDVAQWLYDILKARMDDGAGEGVLSDLNRAAIERGLEAMTTAAVVGFYKADNHLAFAYAGHPPAYLRRASGGGWEPVVLPSSDRIANIPLAVAMETEYEQRRIPLEQGDRILLYTDGILEAPSPAGEQLGRERFEEILATADRSSRGDLMTLKNSVLDGVRRHTSGPLNHDDVTFMVLEVD